MKIRALKASDYEQLYRLYRRQTSDLPYHHNVRRDQFRDELLVTRFIRNPDDHHPRARIALVAKERDRVIGMVSGGIVTNGDEVTESRTGYLQAIIGQPADADLLKEMIVRVVSHLRRFRPKKIVAQDACLSPVFFADSAGMCPSQQAWLGQLLLDSGFEVNHRGLRMVALLESPRREVKPPDDLEFLHVTHEMHGVDDKYDFGCVLLKPPYEYGDGVVWCGSFFSGAFVKGSAFRSLYINWFTIMDEAYRGRGLGRFMLRHCLQQAQQRGAKYASLLSGADNFVAHNLYQSEGFRVVDATHAFELKR